MSANPKTPYHWAIVGAGPAGLACCGLLIDHGISHEEIILFDPSFESGDFGQHWGEVNSNTSVKLFLEFLTQIKAFNFDKNTTRFPLEQLSPDAHCQLSDVAKPLAWTSKQLRQKVPYAQTHVTSLKHAGRYWQIQTKDKEYLAENVILATGATPKSLSLGAIEEIPLQIALQPTKLNNGISKEDTIAVFGASHSAMIILKNCLDAGAKHVVNFYRSPHRYAVNMGDWTLYDNTGLKGLTAQWTRQHITHEPHPQISRYHATASEIQAHLPKCNKAIYAIGFTPRYIPVEGVSLENYDKSNGIIAPGLFGAGIAFPRLKTDPFGNQELNVGLFKFMNDIRATLPIWLSYAK